MGGSKKSSKIYRALLNKAMKKNGVITWRYIFNASERDTAVEKMFYLELVMLNPYETPSTATLGFKERKIFNEEDLQYALAGTESAHSIQTEEIMKPSFISVRFGEFGNSARQTAIYYSADEVSIKQKPFEIKAGNCTFTENSISGFINLEKEVLDEHPEFLCDAGYVKYAFDLEMTSECEEGYKSKEFFWCPVGIRTNFSGTMNYNGYDYNVNPKTSFGYIEKFYGKEYPAPWFHLSGSCIQSSISGRTLFDSSFAVQGVFENLVSFVANFEGTKLEFIAGKTKFNSFWECVQSPKTDEDEKLHWSVSINDKTWVIDIDIYCKVEDLSTRKLEMSEGNRKVLSLIETGSGYGEIKVFKHTKKSLEQIEYMRITKTFCQFGNIE